MSNDNDFPKLDGGWCDGLGCSGLCWCGERLAMKEEFQRVYNKPWKESYDKNPDSDCVNVNHLVRFATDRVESHFKKEMENKQAEINRLKEQLKAHIVIYQKETDGELLAKRCEDDAVANTFIRENDLCVDDCKVVGGGWILTRAEPSKMWFYKRAEQK